MIEAIERRAGRQPARTTQLIDGLGDQHSRLTRIFMKDGAIDADEAEILWAQEQLKLMAAWADLGRRLSVIVADHGEMTPHAERLIRELKQEEERLLCLQRSAEHELELSAGENIRALMTTGSAAE